MSTSISTTFAGIDEDQLWEAWELHRPVTSRFEDDCAVRSYTDALYTGRLYALVTQALERGERPDYVQAAAEAAQSIDGPVTAPPVDGPRLRLLGS